MTQNANEKPDAFKAVMAAARTELGRPELARQSMGRELSEAEEVLADALMDIYASGVTGANAVARALAKKVWHRQSRATLRGPPRAWLRTVQH